MRLSASARPGRRRGNGLRAAGVAVLMVALGWSVAGCVTPARERARLKSGNPIERALAAKRLGAWRDARAVPGLIGLLEDDDHGVRMIAIRSLRRICGEDLGYRYYADERERAAAVERWRAALRQGELRGTAASSATASEP